MARKCLFGCLDIEGWVELVMVGYMKMRVLIEGLADIRGDVAREVWMGCSFHFVNQEVKGSSNYLLDCILWRC